MGMTTTDKPTVEQLEAELAKFIRIGMPKMAQRTRRLLAAAKEATS